MIQDYEPTIPEWFHQQFELNEYLAEQRARVDTEEREAARRRILYFAGTVICWLAVSVALMISTHQRSPVVNRPSEPVIPVPSGAPAPLKIQYVQPQDPLLPLLPESRELEQVADELGAIEVQGELFTRMGESYRGPLWVRKVKQGESVFLEDAVLFEIYGPFRMKLPANSTVYVYAAARGLDWNGGWGAPIQTPSCSQSGICVVRLEGLIPSTDQLAFAP
jgi:hypothetical protein